MTGELHHIRHTLVPPNEHSQRLHSNAQGYLDKLNVGYATQSRPPVAKISPFGTLGDWLWDSIESIGSFAIALAVGVLMFGFCMWMLT